MKKWVLEAFKRIGLETFEVTPEDFATSILKAKRKVS